MGETPKSTNAEELAVALVEQLADAILSGKTGSLSDMGIDASNFLKIARDPVARVTFDHCLHRKNNIPQLREIIAAHLFSEIEGARALTMPHATRTKGWIFFGKTASAATTASAIAVLATGSAVIVPLALVSALGVAVFGYAMNVERGLDKAIADVDADIRHLEELRRLLIS